MILNVKMQILAQSWMQKKKAKIGFQMTKFDISPQFVVKIGFYKIKTMVVPNSNITIVFWMSKAIFGPILNKKNAKNMISNVKIIYHIPLKM